MSDGDAISISQPGVSDTLVNGIADQSIEEEETLGNDIGNQSLEDMQLSVDNTDDGTDTNNLDTEASITSVTELSNAEESNYAENETSRSIPGLNSFSRLGSNAEWYNQKCFKRYWDHYHFVMAWCRKHYQTYNKLTQRESVRQRTPRQQRCGSNHRHYNYPVQQQQSYRGGLPWQHGFPWQQGQGQTEVKVTSRRRNRRPRKKKDEVIPQEEEEKDQESAQVSGSDHAFEMEITEEMIEFFSKSEEHRKQRDEEKKEAKEKQKNEPDLMNLEDVQASPQRERTVEAPKERPGARRTSEMKMLYGKGAAMIHGMETALQMTFDRNKDLKQPKMWPNMPLKIVFN